MYLRPTDYTTSDRPLLLTVARKGMKQIPRAIMNEQQQTESSPARPAQVAVTMIATAPQAAATTTTTQLRR